MLKTIKSIESATNLKETKSKTGGNGVVGNSMVGGNKVTNPKSFIKRKNQAKMTKSKILVKFKNRDFLPNSRNIEARLDFLIPEARLAFIKLKQVFIKAPILHYFYPKCYIRTETDVSRYTIGEILSQLSSNDLGQWHPVAFFSQKTISADIRYKTYYDEFLAIVKTFKIWQHYLEGCKQEVFVLIDHNNLCCFMDIKSLSFRQVRWAKKLSRYYFCINY